MTRTGPRSREGSATPPFGRRDPAPPIDRTLLKPRPLQHDQILAAEADVDPVTRLRQGEAGGVEDVGEQALVAEPELQAHHRAEKAQVIDQHAEAIPIPVA